MRPGHWLSSALMLSLFFLLPTWGDVPDAPPLGACYMGYGKMLEAAQSRQLSLNAHVTRILYQPGGLEIAYEGGQKDGDEVTQFIRLAGVRRGATTTLASTTTHTGPNGEAVESDVVPYSLAGWSGNGRYLLLEQEHFVLTSSSDGGYFSARFQCIDVGSDPIHTSPIPLPDVQEAASGVIAQRTHYWWSPDRSCLLFAIQGLAKKGERRTIQEAFAGAYDLKTGKIQAITAGDQQAVRGWIDNTHLLRDDSPLLVEFTPSRKTHYAGYDLATGTQSEVSKPTKMSAQLDDMDNESVGVSPKAAFLRLDDEPHHIQDEQKVGAVDAHALWVRRTQGPKLRSVAPVGLTPGKDAPQAVWSPTGTQVAFIAHGDLFVTDLTMRDATMAERYTAGEKFTCSEERDFAEDDLKQIGLALLQYNQDNDEKFPPADQWQDSVKPYFGPDILLNIGGHPVIYHMPAGVTLASIDEPSDTVLGTIDLPCATVTLYADGHVKSLPKAVVAPSAENDQL